MPMQMSKKEIQLRQQFTEKKQQADKALQEGKTDEARALLDEVKQLKNQIELMTEGRSLDVPDLPGGVNLCRSRSGIQKGSVHKIKEKRKGNSNTLKLSLKD